MNRLITTGVLVRDASGAPRLRTAADAGTVAAAAPADGGDSFLHKLAMAAVQNAAQSPRDSIKDMIDIAKLITPPPQPAIDLEAIIERVAARMKPAETLDVFGQYEKIDSFLSKFRPAPAAGVLNAIAGDAAGGGDSWAPHLEGIFSAATNFITTTFAGLRELRSSNGAPSPVPVASNGAAAAPALATLADRIETVFRMGFQEMQKGVSGYDFAGWVCLRMAGGLEAYRALEPNGAAGLLAMIGSNAAAAPLLKNAGVRAQLEAFLSDFCSFDSTVEERAGGVAAAATAS